MKFKLLLAAISFIPTLVLAQAPVASPAVTPATIQKPAPAPAVTPVAPKPSPNAPKPAENPNGNLTPVGR